MSTSTQSPTPDAPPAGGASPLSPGGQSPGGWKSGSRWRLAGLILLLALGLFFTVLFGLRTLHGYRSFHDQRGRPPREATGDVAPWMTVPYIAHAYGVPEEFLYTQLGVPAQENDRRALMQLERTYFNGERGLLRDKVRAALELYYAGAIPTPLPPDPALAPLPDQPPHPPPDATAAPPAPDAPNAGGTP